MKHFYILALGLLGLSFNVEAVNKVADQSDTGNLLYCKSPITGDTDFTIEMWVKGTMGGGAYGRLFSHRVGNNYIFEIAAGDGVLKIYDGSWRTTTGTSVNDDKWHHVAVTKGKDSLFVFLDGNKVYKKAAPTLNFSSVDNVGFGGNVTSLIASANVNAHFDEIRIWDIARSEQDIITNMNTKIVKSTIGLLAYYSFDGSDELIDDSGRGNNLSKKGVVTYPVTDYDYILDYGFDMDGVDDSFSLPTPISGTNMFTLEAQFNTTASGSYKRIFGWSAYKLEVALSNGRIAYYMGAWEIASAATYNDGKWHHIAVTNDGAELKIFVDGELITTTSQRPNLSGTMYVGDGYTNSGNLFGEIDEVRVWGVARTQLEIQDNSNVELVGDEIGLVSYFDMNTVAVDVINVTGGANMTRNGSGGANNTPQYIEVMKMFTILSTEDFQVSKNGDSLIIYPNPTKGVVYFGETLEQVELTNLLGQIILKTSNVSEIELTQLQKGAYIVKTEKGTQKLIVE